MFLRKYTLSEHAIILLHFILAIFLNHWDFTFEALILDLERLYTVIGGT